MSRAQLMADVKQAQKQARRPLTRLRYLVTRFLNRLDWVKLRTALQDRGLWPYSKPTYYGGVLPNPPRRHRWEV